MYVDHAIATWSQKDYICIYNVVEKIHKSLFCSGSFSSVFKHDRYIPMGGKHKSNHMLESSSGWSLGGLLEGLQKWDERWTVKEDQLMLSGIVLNTLSNGSEQIWSLAALGLTRGVFILKNRYMSALALPKSTHVGPFKVGFILLFLWQNFFVLTPRPFSLWYRCRINRSHSLRLIWGYSFYVAGQDSKGVEVSLPLLCYIEVADP